MDNKDAVRVTGFEVSSLNRVRPVDGPFQVIGIDQNCNECAPRRTARTFKQACTLARTLCKEYGIKVEE